MIFKGNLNALLRIFVGLVFLVSAISKLISIDSFEIYVYSFGILKLNSAFLLTRFIISIELFTGVLLITGIYSRAAIPASVAMLSVFSGFIIFLFLTRNNEHCHCFGEIEMSHTSSLIKNLILIVLLLLSYHKPAGKFKYDRLILIISFIFSICTPVIVSPPDSFFYHRYSKGVTFNNDILSEYLKENSQYSKGKKILCFLGTQCRFCKLTARKITVIAKKTNDSEVINFVFAGSQTYIDNFFSETNSTIFPYTILPPNRFLKITNGSMPLIILLENGNIKGKYGYRDLNEDELTEFIRN